jgi:tripeptidyl-peptidase-1
MTADRNCTDVIHFAPFDSPNGRGFPDVAAQGLRFEIVTNGAVHSISGTSASAPVRIRFVVCPLANHLLIVSTRAFYQTFAGVVALLNDARLANKKAPLGFLNPLLYSDGVNGLNDITSGNNPGCNTTVRSHFLA